jgi:L-threonylcarbamoyladenylate synthase
LRILPPNDESIAEAAEHLRKGRLVGMPTETVYGVGANAGDEAAVLATFEAKGRPSDNPLIVHIADKEMLSAVAREIPPDASLLMDRFWPGPLTLVLKKAPSVPAVTTAGLDTVAVRMPNHTVALDLIRAAGVPVSAPSANLFSELSPTRADSINPAIGDKLAVILDGGPCEVGIESTVVDITGSTPRVLRPGQVSRYQLEEALGKAVSGAENAERLSPGMYPRHYAPRTATRLVERLSEEQAGLTFHAPENDFQIRMPQDSVPYGALLYESLRRLDEMGVPGIFIEEPPREPEWEAIWDRLNRATQT